MKTLRLIAFIMILASPLNALTVKLGSPFPEGSPWDSTLKRMAAEWSDITGGRVRMRIYAGGIAGSEADMIRKMRIRQLDAAVITTFGLKSIVPNTFVMSLPGILQSEEELDYVIERFTPRFSQDFINQGFRILAWSKSGWAYFFTGHEQLSPALLRNDRLAVSNTDEELAANFKAMGFNVVPTGLNEVVVGLQSGMINAIYCPPMAAAAYQWFPQVPHMLEFPVAPVLGGLVISEQTWKRIPSEYHEELAAAIRDVAREFYAESERLNAEAKRVMKGYGVTFESVGETARQEWYEVMREGHALVVGEGKWIDDAIYADLLTALDEFR
ncbi:MAG: TRAP transporter substrate-binding protein DctP [Spirochaetales bacterium]|nr:TRAP transporter substrate-binding protein DctP [Spirochaetales bacterium]